MFIGEVSRQVGLSEHTLRYYEKVGLLPPPKRRAGGQRVFDARDLQWLALLVKLRKTKMPLRQMLVYAELVRQGDDTIPERLDLLARHERKVVETIAEMTSCLETVREKLAIYGAKLTARKGGETP